ncbi:MULTISPECIES: AraC family transcriptional regulator [Pseudonocardia]|uniref:HTH-type transcriptional regulator CdhR n=2 Tax=Pseudonocardia TaxID=1847 RepID=A0A1Y2ML13_PSEAH|nr:MULTISPECIES: AraC family transcriptional regulator [Pseudonocardia]OSY35158.1 HTH-type transcriptional regulator CdhR [Pseudonocardia autotrophica]TDN74969.1 AraC-like DNA-binding protein [Pseudonocardia autotrophica]BBF98907.1 hypothetical protein Pdca_01170 [Pseudonocardia autotrophica]GEC28629.1 hypothetical protein PSA01_56580 [Pseudonocardia saturnea]
MADPEATAACRPTGPLAAHPLLRSSDPDEIRSRAVALLNGHSMRLSDRAARLCADIRGVQVAGLRLMAFRYGAGVEIGAPPLDDFVTIHLPVRGGFRLEHLGRSVAAGVDRGAVISAVAPLRMEWSADLVLLVVRLERAALRERWAAVLGEQVDADPVFEPAVDAGSALPGAVRALFGAVEASGPAGLRPTVAAEFERTIGSLLVLEHRHSSSEQLTRHLALPSPRVLRDALAHLDTNPDRAVPVAELARVAGVGERTLLAVFRRHLGTTPAAHSRRIRLDRARRDLLGGGPHASVTRIALDNGFAHAGRFAAAYRARFGEHPSVTLRR